jgi:Uncharacterized protein conserved in bacteria
MNPIVFYDGECDFCNRWVQWIIDRDAGRVFRFASLQSGFAREVFLHYDMTVALNSIVIFKDNKEFLAKSEAVSYIFAQLKPDSVFYKMMKVLPRFLSDFGYDCIAGVRKKLKKRSCRLLSKEEKRLFLNDTDFTVWLSENNAPKKPVSFPLHHKK